MNKERLYYDEDGGEFYWVKETPNTFTINWVAKYNCDSEKTPLDQNVRWGKTMRVSKNIAGRHCLKSYDDEYILIYPNQAGVPFYLEPATMTHITSEIASCLMWGVSSDYYEDLKKFITDKDLVID